MTGEDKTELEPTEVKVKDPFPNLTFAKRHLWNFLDHWAYRRALKLGVPNPWHSFSMGYDRAIIEIKIKAVETK